MKNAGLKKNLKDFNNLIFQSSKWYRICRKYTRWCTEPKSVYEYFEVECGIFKNLK